MSWLATAGGYEVTLRQGSVVCRNATGKELRTLPKAVRDHDVVSGLRQLSEWLERHEAQCRADVERWMVRSLPVPMTLLVQVWADEAWRAALTDLVVAVLDDDGGWDPAAVGLLRDVDPAGIGVVDLDGDTVRRPGARIAVPHPVLLPDLDDLREFAADLKVRQGVDQLFRQTSPRPVDLDPKRTAVTDFAGGKFAELRHLTARATTLGYPVRGGSAVCRVFEDGRAVEARYWVGTDPYYETETGDLVFTDPTGVTRPLGEVGPVAWSEGIRMAAALYAGRIVDQKGTDA